MISGTMAGNTFWFGIHSPDGHRLHDYGERVHFRQSPCRNGIFHPTPVPVMTTAPASAQICITDDDCVPAQCAIPRAVPTRQTKGCVI